MKEFKLMVSGKDFFDGVPILRGGITLPIKDYIDHIYRTFRTNPDSVFYEFIEEGTFRFPKF